MAYRLDKKESARRDELVEKLKMARGKVEHAAADAEEKVQAALEPVNEAIAEYNELLNEAKGFAEEVASERRSDYDEKSERWQEGDKGQAASSWLDEWEGFSDDTVSDLTLPTVEVDEDLDAGDRLEELPEEADA